MKTSRRPLLDHVYNPQGLGQIIRDQDRRLNRIERAPVKATIVVPKKKKVVVAHVEPVITLPTMIGWYEMSIVFGTFQSSNNNIMAPGDSVDAEITLNEKTYPVTIARDGITGNYSRTWTVTTPYLDPPAGYSTSITGFLGDARGYYEWLGIQGPSVPFNGEWKPELSAYRVYHTEAELEVIFGPPLAIGDTDFRVLRSNADNSPYNGLGLGYAQAYFSAPDPSINLDDVEQLTESYIWPLKIGAVYNP